MLGTAIGYERPPRGGGNECRHTCERNPLKGRPRFAAGGRLHEVSSDAKFTVTTYASLVGIAVALLQDQGGGLQLVSYWALKLNNPVERGNTYYVYDS
jgi:hypothetical protein